MVAALELDKLVVRHPVVVAKHIFYEFTVGHDIFRRCESQICRGRHDVQVKRMQKARLEGIRSSIFVPQIYLAACTNDDLGK